MPFGRDKQDKSEPAQPEAAAALDQLIDTSAKELAAATAQRPPAPAKKTDGLFFVVVSGDSEDRSEISTFADVNEAQTFIQGLLENGTDRSAVAAFQATPLTVKVAYRPAVRFPLEPVKNEAEQS